MEPPAAAVAATSTALKVTWQRNAAILFTSCMKTIEVVVILHSRSPDDKVVRPISIFSE